MLFACLCLHLSFTSFAIPLQAQCFTAHVLQPLRFFTLMPDFALLDSLAATTQQEPSKRLAYTIHAKGGYIAANHGPKGPPIALVKDVTRATRFTEFITAHRRAAALADLGWSGLTVVTIELPSLFHTHA